MNVLFCVVCEMIAINIVELLLLHEERRSPFFCRLRIVSLQTRELGWLKIEVKRRALVFI